MEKKGGIPKGELNAIIALELDMTGKVVDYKIINSSGNELMDAALEETLKVAVLRDPPPTDMPRVIKLKILSQG
nr:TonB C-terminal domain-containing protein [Desulfobulbaceae bacterium]